jgi:hypothetical protein
MLKKTKRGRYHLGHRPAPKLCNAGKGSAEECAIYRVEDDGDHDRTPLFDRLGMMPRLCFRRSSSRKENGFFGTGIGSRNSRNREKQVGIGAAAS